MAAVHSQAVFIVFLILIVDSAAFILLGGYYLYQQWQKDKFASIKGFFNTKVQKVTPEVPEIPVIQQKVIFVDLSPKSADIVELAVEVWRIKNRITSVGGSLTDIQRRGLESSIQKFAKFLDRNDIKITDYTGQKYNEGMNVDVISFEKSDNVKTPMIKETVEPSIVCKDHIIKRGKIIVINN